jgi:hypothetical protein
MTYDSVRRSRRSFLQKITATGIVLSLLPGLDSSPNESVAAEAKTEQIQIAISLGHAWVRPTLERKPISFSRRE